MIGKLSFNQLALENRNDVYILKWNALQKKGDVKIYVSKTNLFSEGKKDRYDLIKVLPVRNGSFILPASIVSKMQKGIFKIVVVGRDSTANVWL